MCRLKGDFAAGYRIARPAIDLEPPGDGLFIETWIYEFGVCDEYAVNAYWIGRDRDCLDATLKALSRGKVPPHERERMYQNMRFALDRLPADPAPEPIAAAPMSSAPPTSVSTTSAPAEMPTALNLGSGKDFRDDCFNVDIDASWNPDLVLDLSRVVLTSDVFPVATRRFGDVALRQGSFESIIANDVLEHVPDLVGLMTTCLGLLRVDGLFKVSVPYDLSFGAWQDPTHVRTFNERSWLYYTDWFWYVGWRDARFVVDDMTHVLSALGHDLQARDIPIEDIVRTPRAIDSMAVTLRKILLTPDDLGTLARWRDRRPPTQPVATMAAPTALAGSWADNKDRFCIWNAAPQDYGHRRAFDEVALVLSEAFATCGGSAPVVESRAAWAERIPIVLGGHLLAAGQTLPPAAVVYNLEQVDERSLLQSATYRDLLVRHPVLDYSERNSAALANLGVAARHMPIRAMPGLRRISPVASPDVDVLFYGSISKRRAAILDALRARGLAVVHRFGVYGDERDAAIARAKVVVNIHYYDAAIFESVRIVPLLANGICVVSEGFVDDPDCADLAGALVLCPYDAIVDRCVQLVRDDGARLALSEQARAAMASRSQADVLRSFFEA